MLPDAWVGSRLRSGARLHSDSRAAAADPKFSPGPEGRWPVYVPADEDLAKIEAALPAVELGKITLRRLPAPTGFQGLLYLPYAYVVPGGRFNEMYGWDSYFIE